MLKTCQDQELRWCGGYSGEQDTAPALELRAGEKMGENVDKKRADGKP